MAEESTPFVGSFAKAYFNPNYLLPLEMRALHNWAPTLTSIPQTSKP
jgi:hypothetical protein